MSESYHRHLIVSSVSCQANDAPLHGSPYEPTLSHGGHAGESVDFDQALAASFDCAVVATDHSVFDYAAIGRLPLVVDTRNTLKDTRSPAIFRL